MIARYVIETLTIVFCSFLFMATCLAQDSLSIGGKLFRLGMTRSEALRLIPSEYKVQEFDSETVFITEKREQPYEPLGEIHFKKGRIVSIARFWVTGETASEFAKTLYGALESVTGGVPQLAKLSTCSHIGPQFGELRQLDISIGNRMLNVAVGDPARQVGSAIWESIRSKDAGPRRMCPPH